MWFLWQLFSPSILFPRHIHPYHFTPTRMCVLERKRKKERERKQVLARTYEISWWGDEGHSSQGQVWWFLKKGNVELPDDPSNVPTFSTGALTSTSLSVNRCFWISFHGRQAEIRASTFIQLTLCSAIPTEMHGWRIQTTPIWWLQR